MAYGNNYVRASLCQSRNMVSYCLLRKEKKNLRGSLVWTDCASAITTWGKLSNADLGDLLRIPVFRHIQKAQWCFSGIILCRRDILLSFVEIIRDSVCITYRMFVSYILSCFQTLARVQKNEYCRAVSHVHIHTALNARFKYDYCFL